LDASLRVTVAVGGAHTQVRQEAPFAASSRLTSRSLVNRILCHLLLRHWITQTCTCTCDASGLCAYLAPQAQGCLVQLPPPCLLPRSQVQVNGCRRELQCGGSQPTASSREQRSAASSRPGRRDWLP